MPSLDASEAPQPDLAATRGESVTAVASPTERIVAMLRGLLPEGASVAVCWRDWALGSGGALSPGGTAELRRHADQVLSEPQAEVDSAQLLVHGWDNLEGSARMAVAAQLREPLGDAERKSWLALAKTLVVATLDASRAQARILSLEKSKRLQQALYEIADLASADLEMPEMLRRIHVVLGSLMYADNCYIVLYDDQRRSVRFLHFVDQKDPYVADPEREFTEEEMPNSMTFALLRHGQPVRGPSVSIRQKLGVIRDLLHGPDSQDWLGVPMRRDD